MRRRIGKSEQREESWLGGEQRTVAFVDILGFSDEVKQRAPHPANFRKLVTALLGSSAVADAPGDKDDLLSILASQEGEEWYGVDLQYAFFSDSTYISARTVPGGVDRVLSLVLRYAQYLLMRGFFVRGGVSRGAAAHRGGMVVGPAVLAAYGIELKAAVYPRIVLEDAVAVELLTVDDQPNETATIRRGEDGLYFLDVLTTLGLRGEGEAVLRRTGTLILERLKQRGSLDIDAKWRWLAAQYNRAVRSVAREGKMDLPRIERRDVVELSDSPQGARSA